MIAETISELLTWTEKHHCRLKSCLQETAYNSQDKRTRMLAEYLIDCEARLIQLVRKFHKLTKAKVLQTYCVEYISEYEPFTLDTREGSYTNMDTKQLFSTVMAEHNDLIELYRHLKARAGTPEVANFAEEMLSMEVHETQRISQASNRLQDI